LPNSQPNQTTGGAPNQTAPLTSANNVSIQITGFKFAPADVEVSVGTTVTWVNNDPVSHTVTFDNGEFDTGSFPHGDNRSYTFSSLGKYTYHCSIHPSMKGNITVTIHPSAG
jgi:plastocyanin